ncbi:PIF-1 [Dikerogammarus haemobaphes nudivirus]|nr:PIF-1 [Dikerogammarus haemobaphes nudivirus]
MEKRLTIFIIFAIICIILIIFLTFTLRSFNQRFKETINDNMENIEKLQKFSYNIYFNPPPETIIIENSETCSAETLKLCDVNDPFSCANCANLISKCTNIATDTRYIDFNGVESIIPANENENQGYCLARSNPEQMCNPFHGDLVFVQTDQNSTDVMLLCECKNPGFIGKTTIDGTCEEVFICDGKIDDINQSIENISCQCGPAQISSTINNVPTCRDKTVGEYEYTENDFIAAQIKSTTMDTINSTIRNNYKGDYIRDPCRYCLFTGEFVENGKMVSYIDEEGETGYQCVVIDEKKPGVPVRRNPTYRILKGAEGADAVIGNMYINNIIMYGYTKDPKFEDIVIGLNMEKNKTILQRMNIYQSDLEMVVMNLVTHQLVFPGSFGSGQYENRVSTFYCTQPDAVHGVINGWDYKCYFDTVVPSDRNPSYCPAEILIFDNFSVRLNWYCSAHHSVFLSYEWWKEYEGYNPLYRFDDVYRVNGLLKMETRPEVRKKRVDYCQYMFVSINYATNTIQGYLAADRNLTSQFQAGLIPKPDWEDN